MVCALMLQERRLYLQQACCILCDFVLQEGRHCILAGAAHPCPHRLSHLQSNMLLQILCKSIADNEKHTSKGFT